MSSGIVTALALLAFVAVVIWVFIVKNREDFDQQAHLPLEEDRQDDHEEEKSS